MFKVGRSGFYGRAKTDIDQKSITLEAGRKRHLFHTGVFLFQPTNAIAGVRG